MQDVLVSVCLPVRNGAKRIPAVARSVLAQDHTNLELVISDNASTDETEAVARALAAEDPRVKYHRQAENVGLLNNFVSAMHQATGTYLRWIGDDDAMQPNCVSRSLSLFAEDPRLVMVTAACEFHGDDGIVRTSEYHREDLRSDDPIVRLTEMLRLLNDSYLLIDPLYGVIRRDAVVSIPRRNMLREDQVYSTKLALAGPWGHVNEVLYRRGFQRDERRAQLARRLGVPVWTARAANTLQGREMLRWVSEGADLTPEQRRQGRAAVRKWYVDRQQIVLSRRGRRLAQVVGLGGSGRNTAEQPG
ncbi:glycosyltransferase family 2 protein [Dactylosporangium sp. NPDC051541]|uniref:glycosyltransferase family 2 protein n=1 Tax=Dactylosporangium sp. NPDC051541 TaxID=3363977 RepID=UPI0037A4414B